MFDRSTAPRVVKDEGHVAGYAAVELVAGDTAWFREDCFTVIASAEIE